MQDVETYQVESGFHLVTLNFKTDKKTQVKAPSVAYIVPKLSTIAGSNENQTKAMNKWIDSMQRGYLAEYHAGEYDYRDLILNLDKMFEEYVTDRRGNRTGMKQSQLMEWITDVLVPFFTARIEKTLVNFTQLQKQDMVIAYVKKFKLAATRGNKSGNETLSDDALKDLEQRINRWTESGEGSLPLSDELECLVERIANHRKAIANSVTDVSTDMF